MTSEGRGLSPEDESLWGWKDGRPTFDGADLCPCSTPAWSHTAAAHDTSGRTTSSPDWWQRRFWTLPFWMRGWELVAFILAAYVLGILLGVAR